MMGSSTSSQAPAKESHPAAVDVIGRWMYESLAIDYKGDSSVASIAVATIESQLPTIAAKFELVAGRDYVDVGGDGTITFVHDQSKMSAACTSYSAYTGKALINIRYKEQTISLTADVIEVEGNRCKLMFDAISLMNILSQNMPNFSENTTLQMANEIIKNYPGIRIGVMTKK